MDEPGLARAYQAFTRCHDLVAGATDEHALLKEFCASAVRELGFRLAWVGLVTPGQTRVRPVAQAGFEDGYLDTVTITTAEDVHGAGPTGTAIRTGRSNACQDIARDPRFAPWRADALERGYASSVAIPLLEGGRCLGALNLYAAEPDAFDDDEVALLEEVALTLVIGMARLRTAARLVVLEAGLQRAAIAEAAGTAAAALAHDLNNHLMLAMVALDSARTQAGNAPPMQADLQAAFDATRSAAAMMRRLLALFRPEPGSSAASRCQPDVELLAARALLSRLAAPAVLELAPGAPSRTVGVGALDVERVLVNLVANAAAAAPRGSTITVRTHVVDTIPAGPPPLGGPLAEGPHLVLGVEDHGEGIAPDALGRVFEPYFTTRGQAGTGLGLPSVLAVARAAGGSVDVRSRPGQGTTVSVFLPVVAG